ncbi:extracellular solute-binding protein [Kribbella solani]|uniref:extracellular solute-binding protein n=1 Tax=Kribbella solani TaxID=236067 RepID=UPI0029A3361E|nr:extracellular solute-binding protein [Kribbella solani]MDX3006550.1 extracellular solute-binding protein [Kribbella solani]
MINLNTDGAEALSKAGFLMDLETAAPGIGDGLIPDLYKESAVPGTAGHQILPWYGSANVLTYDTALFKAAGLDPARPAASSSPPWQILPRA